MTRAERIEEAAKDFLQAFSQLPVDLAWSVKGRAGPLIREASEYGVALCAALSVPPDPVPECPECVRLREALQVAFAWLESHGHPPESCGACGTPNACCDCDCALAARWGEDKAKITTALAFVKGKDKEQGT